MARPARITLLVALAIAVGWWFAAGRGPRAAKPTAGHAVIVFGDSLVEGVGATPGHDLAALLSSRLGVTVVNAGHRGDTATDALDRIDGAVLSRDPRIVVVLLGGNDFLRRVPRETTFAALGTIITRIRERGSAVVLVGVSLGLISDQYSAEYEALAGQTQAAYVPDVLGGILGHGELMADQVHPNDRGYALMADRIAPVVRDLLP